MTRESYTIDRWIIGALAPDMFMFATTAIFAAFEYSIFWAVLMLWFMLRVIMDFVADGTLYFYRHEDDEAK